MIFDFGDFAPDLSTTLKGKSSNIINVLPQLDGYSPFPSFVSNGVAALPSRCIGAVSVKDLSGISRIYLGTSSKLYEVSGLSLNDRTNVGGDYNLTGIDQWEFTVGKNQLIATTLGEPVQVVTFGGNNFEDLITSTRKPSGKHAVISYLDWLTLANVTDAVDGDRPNRVWWSERGNYRNMDPDIDKRCGFRDLDQQYGEIVSLHAREFTTVFQERAIHRMTFEGGASTFRFDLVETNLGLISPGAIAHFGPYSFYLSFDGFQMFDGTQSIPIGVDTVDRYALDRIDYNSVAWISTAIYPKNKIVAWALPFPGSTNLSHLLIFNWVSKKWAEVYVNIEKLFSSYTLSIGVDDVNFADLYIDSFPQSEWLIDDPAFAGGLPIFSAIDTNHSYKVAAGSAMPPTLETNYLTIENRSVIDTVIAIVEKAVNPQLFVYTKDDLSLLTENRYGPYTPNLFREFVPTIQGRHFRFGFTCDDFVKAIGLNVRFLNHGAR